MYFKILVIIVCGIGTSMLGGILDAVMGVDLTLSQDVVTSIPDVMFGGVLGWALTSKAK